MGWCGCVLVCVHVSGCGCVCGCESVGPTLWVFDGVVSLGMIVGAKVCVRVYLGIYVCVFKLI